MQLVDAEDPSYQALNSDSGRERFKYGMPKGNQQLFDAFNASCGNIMMLSPFAIHFATTDAKSRRWPCYLRKNPADNGTVK